MTNVQDIAGVRFDEADAADRTWVFCTCLKCRQMAVVAPNGMTICPTCDARKAELQRLLASVARMVTYGSLKTCLLGTSNLHRPQVAAA